MADVDLQLKAIDALVHIHLAIKNDQQYPSTNPAIINFIETLYLYLADILRQDAPLVFAELEKKVLSGENISDQKEDKTINVSFLQDIFSGLDFKRFSFDEKPETEELYIIINLLKRNRKPAQDEVSLPEPVAENKIEQISPDNKVYLTLGKDQEIVTGLDNAEDKIPEGVAGTEQVFTRINVLDGAIESIPSEDKVEDKIPEGVASMEKVITRINALDGAIESIPSEEKMDMLRKLSIQSAEWVEKEDTVTPEYKELCQRLEALLQEFISNGFFSEATPIINVFNKIYNGTLKKDDDIREISLKVLRNLASSNNFNILFKEINTNENNKKSEAGQIFAGFGSLVIDKLLDGLKKASDSKARISIIHIIEEMGPTAIPAVKASISMNTPWYYLRNMAYVLGRIGNETSVDVLKPLLLHTEKRVRKEAFKSIVQTGGNMRGPLLLSMLFLVDQQLRVDIIEVLGKIKCKEAVTDLHNMLKSNSMMAKNDQISVPEKICNALGAIGSPEAIKVLTAIAESKSILGIGAYPKEVKNAAERTLAYIKRKQEE